MAVEHEIDAIREAPGGSGVRLMEAMSREESETEAIWGASDASGFGFM